MTTRDRPQAPPHLDGHRRRTFDAIFRRPTAHDLRWREVRSLLDAVSDVIEGEGGALRASRDGRVVSLHAPGDQDLATIDDLLAIRRFLGGLGDSPFRPTIVPGVRLVVVIDRREAKVYRTDSPGAVPSRLVPYDPHGLGRHLRSEAPEVDGMRRPERRGFYDAVAETLRGADEILIFGRGPGEGRAMEHLLADLKTHHADLAGRVVGSMAIDEHHRNEGQLLAQARDFLRACAS